MIHGFEKTGALMFERCIRESDVMSFVNNRAHVRRDSATWDGLLIELEILDNTFFNTMHARVNRHEDVEHLKVDFLFRRRRMIMNVM